MTYNYHKSIQHQADRLPICATIHYDVIELCCWSKILLDRVVRLNTRKYMFPNLFLDKIWSKSNFVQGCSVFSSQASCVKERIFPLTDLDSSDLGKSWLKMQHNGVKMVFMKRFDEIFFQNYFSDVTLTPTDGRWC